MLIWRENLALRLAQTLTEAGWPAELRAVPSSSQWTSGTLCVGSPWEKPWGLASDGHSLGAPSSGGHSLPKQRKRHRRKQRESRDSCRSRCSFRRTEAAEEAEESCGSGEGRGPGMEERRKGQGDSRRHGRGGNRRTAEASKRGPFSGSQTETPK